MAADTAEDAAALPGDEQKRPSAVLAMVYDALARLNVDRRLKQPDAADLKIADLERLHGLPKGEFASILKPSSRGSVPRQPKIRALAAALKLRPSKLADAFMDDYMGDGEEEETVHQQRAADLIGALPTPLQRLGIRQLELLVDHHRACEAAALAQCADEPAT